MKNTISLCINTRNPKIEYLREAIESGCAYFDETLVYFDECVMPPDIGIKLPSVWPLYDGKHRTIADGFNHVIQRASGDWVCSFCDDDYFLHPEIEKLTKAIKDGDYDDADVVHFKIKSGDWVLWGETNEFTLSDLMSHNIIPHGAFFKKQAFERVGGYKCDEWADWNLWLRMKKAGMIFKGFDGAVYYFRQYEGSASDLQIKKHGDKMRQIVMNNL